MPAAAGTRPRPRPTLQRSSDAKFLAWPAACIRSVSDDYTAEKSAITATVSWVQIDRGEYAEDAYNLVAAPRREGVCGRDNYTGRRE